MANSSTANTAGLISSTVALTSATPIPAVPLAHDLRISKDAEDWLKTLSPNWFQNHDEIQHFWSTPGSQFTLTLLADPEFKAATDQMIAANLCSRAVSYELVLILLLWIFRPLRLAKASSWLLRIWTQAWISVVFWVLALVAVPWLVWGQAYLTALKEIFKAFLRHFFT
jgi:hypothetical protein